MFAKTIDHSLGTRNLSCNLWSIWDIVSHCFGSDPTCKMIKAGDLVGQKKISRVKGAKHLPCCVEQNRSSP
jgi:hypothetical protein